MPEKNLGLFCGQSGIIGWGQEWEAKLSSKGNSWTKDKVTYYGETGNAEFKRQQLEAEPPTQIKLSKFQGQVSKQGLGVRAIKYLTKRQLT